MYGLQSPEQVLTFLDRNKRFHVRFGPLSSIVIG
jgi:hypothetical protein